MSNRHAGSSFDNFLEEEKLFSEVETVAIKRFFVYRMRQIKKETYLSKNEMTDNMKKDHN